MESSSEPVNRSDLKTPSELQRQHIPELDGLRGLAILLVTLYRFGNEISQSHSAGPVGLALHLGTHGVELFFVLSGFLITGILLDARGQRHQLRNFFARRSLRILPLYFAALALCLWILPALSSMAGTSSISQAFKPAREQQFFLWCYLTNVQMSLVDAWCFGPLDHFWSLAVEEHFYLLWPLVIVFGPARSLIRITILLTITCVISRTVWLMQGGTATAAEVLTIWRCDGLLLGALVAMLWRTPGFGWQQLARLTQWMWVPLLIVALIIDATERRIWLVNIILWNSVWFCLLVNLIACVGRRPQGVTLPVGRLSQFFQLNWLRCLGKLSYGMYVFQAPLIPLIAAIGWSAGVSLAMDLLYVVGMFALTVGVAWCSWHGFEKHWLRWKDYFPQSDSRWFKRAELSGPETRWGRGRRDAQRATSG